MQESYSWGRSIRRLSRAEIKKMKENMQKTPLIQEKSEQYHKKESLEAEALLEKFETSTSKHQEQWSIEKKENIWFFQKLKAYLFW